MDNHRDDSKVEVEQDAHGRTEIAGRVKAAAEEEIQRADGSSEHSSAFDEDQMSDKQFFRLVHSAARQMASRAVINAPDGYVCKVEPAPKSRDQEQRYHAMIGDIARAVPIFDRLWDREDMKRLLVDQFARDMKNLGTPIRHGGQVVPSIDGTGIVQLGVQTRDFLKAEASAFIEWLFAFGAEHEVRWSETAGHGWEELARGFV